MAKISELSDGGSLQSTDFLIAVRSGGNVKVQADGNLSLGTVTADGLTVDTNTLVVDAANNRVGIGTSSPATRLDFGNDFFNGTPSTLAELVNKVALYSDGAGPAYGFGISSNALNVTAGSGGEVRFHTNGATQQMVVDSNGGVLIGTTVNYGSFQGGYVLSKKGYVFAADDTGSTDNRNWVIAPNGSAAGNLDFIDSSSNTSWPNNAYRMSITKDGNVGIGTSSPAELLVLDKSSGDTFVRFDKSGTFKGLVGISDSAGSGSGSAVAGDVILRSQTRVLLDTGGTTRAVVDASGRVGVGTSSPQFDLQTGNGGLDSRGTGSGIAIRNNIYFDSSDKYLTASGAASTQYFDGSGNIIFYNTGTASTGAGNAVSLSERMRINSSGSVGIGETSPSTYGKLVVAGSTPFAVVRSSDVTTAGFSMLVNSGSNGVGSIATDDGGHMTFDTGSTGAGQAERMRINASGQVGIGGSPDTKLHLIDGGTPELRLESTDASVVSGQSLGDITWEANDASGGGTGVRAKIHAEAENAGTIYGLVFSTGTGAAPTEKVRITNTGLVGIGTGVPSAPLHIVNSTSPRFEMGYGGGSNADHRIAWDSAGLVISADNSNQSTGASYLAMSVDGTEAARFDTSGNLLKRANGNIEVGGYNGGTDYGIVFTPADGSSHWHIYNDAGSHLAFGQSSTVGSSEKMRIDSSGNLLLNETSVSGNAEKFRLTSAGTSSATAAALFNNSAGTELFFVRDDGAFRTGSAASSPYNNTAAVTANLFVNTDGTLVRATSSRRYKKDIVDARFGLSDLLNLRPVNYKGINSEVDGDIVYGGLIAEEVHDAGLTEFVEYNKENQPDALRYQHMVSLCIKAIQEQQDLIESLTARIAQLEGAN